MSKENFAQNIYVCIWKRSWWSCVVKASIRRRTYDVDFKVYFGWMKADFKFKNRQKWYLTLKLIGPCKVDNGGDVCPALEEEESCNTHQCKGTISLYDYVIPG